MRVVIGLNQCIRSQLRKVSYNLYRGTVAGGEDYSRPINGATPVMTLSYPGGDTLMFTDTGLTEGVPYFYTVEAVYPSGVSTPSSLEYGAVPDSQSVPWDTRNSSLITSKIVSLLGIQHDGLLRVMGPDGCVYETGSPGGSLPVGGISSTDTLAAASISSDFSNNVTFAPATGDILSPATPSGNEPVPDALPANADGTLWATAGGELIAAPPTATDPVTKKPSKTGPVRRLLSQSNYVRTTATITLPAASDISQTPADYMIKRAQKIYVNGLPTSNYKDPQPEWTTDDVPNIYLGSGNKNGGVEVDAGLFYQRINEMGPKVWRPFINMAGINAKTYGNGIMAVGDLT